MSIQSDEDLRGMRRAGRAVREALDQMRRELRPGMTTAEVDAIGQAALTRHGARSAPQRDYGFPGVNCISVNEEAVHGIPSERRLRAGDLVKLDVTADLDGYIADAAITVPIPPVSALSRRLCACAHAAFRTAIQSARAGAAVNGIGRAMEREVRRHGFFVLRELSSHGVGRAIHEEPTVPNYYEPRCRDMLTEGLVITVEPIIAAGSQRIVTLPDGWTCRTADGSLSAHFEHTIVITRGVPILVTA